MIKWIGAFFGFRFGGFLGALLGYFIGQYLEGGLSGQASGFYSHGFQRRYHDSLSDFQNYLLFLSALVIKAKSGSSGKEQEFVRNYFIQQFGKQQAEQAFKDFNVFKTEQAGKSVQDVCLSIRQRVSPASRLQLIHYLFNIANIDGVVEPSELSKIEGISDYMGISHGDFLSIKAMFVSDIDGAYKILEVSPEASDSEIKSAYRKMVKKYHPDKLSHLGPEGIKQAEAKFRSLQEAYEHIKKIRNL
jgi:DnaJ like chaperone protein